MQREHDYCPASRAVFTNDTHYLNRADVVLVNLHLPKVMETQKAPFFTIGEMFLAHNRGLPIIVFGNTFRGRSGYEAIVTKTFDLQREAIDYVIKHYW